MDKRNHSHFLPATLLVFFCLLSALALGQAKIPGLMLASAYEGGKDVSDYWVSEKLDGVRGHWDGEALWSRGGNPIAAPEWFTTDWPPVAMDGELWIGRGRFAEVSGVVRSHRAGDQAWQRVKFMVFDLPAHPGNFDERLSRMRGLAENARIPWLRAIEQFRVSTAEELDARLAGIVAEGGEGLMLHHRKSFYRPGRSEMLFKYKPYQDAEARVIGYTQGKGKYQGLVGALIVESGDGRRFRLGSGLSDAERAKPPPEGSWVTYRYNGLTSSSLPRFARFLRIRPEE